MSSQPEIAVKSNPKLSPKGKMYEKEPASYTLQQKLTKIFSKEFTCSKVEVTIERVGSGRVSLTEKNCRITGYVGSGWISSHLASVFFLDLELGYRSFSVGLFQVLGQFESSRVGFRVIQLRISSHLGYGSGQVDFVLWSFRLDRVEFWIVKN